MSDHVSPISLYLTIFFALMILTGVTVAAAYVDLGQFNFAVAMLIAGFKASLVVWYFMHVKYQSHMTKLTVATGLFFLAILLGMSLIDYVSRGASFQHQLPATTPDAVIQPPGPASH
ncbi:MAG TPA: cytochrome C oxidase subunit IV family protein [Vicinamibacterales bacterium]|nr:cytochrome C oxidase subunit IV family protein [Vicinamibacterales bacterium]